MALSDDLIMSFNAIVFNKNIMKNFLMSAVMLTMFLTGCQNEELVGNNENQGRKVTLEVGQMPEGRTELDGTNTLWSVGDQIYVTSADGMTNGVLTLIDGEDTSRGKFSGYVYGDGELKYSVYPVPEYDCVKTNVHDAGKLNALMRGEISNNVVTFENLCSLIPIGSISLTGNEKVVVKSSDYPIGATVKFGLKNGKLTTELVEDIKEVEIVNVENGKAIYLPVFDTDKESRAVKSITLTISIGNVEKTYNNVQLEAGNISNVEIKDLWVEDGKIVEGTAMCEDMKPKAPVYIEASKEYQIYDAAELLWVAEQVNTGKEYFGGKTVKLYSDINLNNVEWEPIGNYDNRFDGSFDGNNKKILNLQILENGNYSALIGGLGKDKNNNASRTVKNVVIENVNIYGGQYTAALIAVCFQQTTISDIQVLGDVKIEGHQLTGGVVGGTSRSLTNVCVNVDKGSYVKTYGPTVGGVAGGLSENQKLTNVVSNIDVIVPNLQDISWATEAVGGLVGYAASGVTFDNCKSMGSVEIQNAETMDLAKKIGAFLGISNWKSNIVFNNCSFEGSLSSSSYGEAVKDFAYQSFVGSVKDGSKVTVDGKEVK